MHSFPQSTGNVAIICHGLFNTVADQAWLASLIQTKNNIDKMVNMEANLKDLCARMVPDLDNCTNQDKKDAYTYLDLKVKVTPEGADIKDYLDPGVLGNDSLSLLTIEQTSGCLSSHAYDWAVPFSYAVKL